MKTTKQIKLSDLCITDLQDMIYKLNYYKQETGFLAVDLWGIPTLYLHPPTFGGTQITKIDILRAINNI